MKNFSLLIKPSSADCNLHCDYCFYYNHKNFYPKDKIHRMDEKTLEKLISNYMNTEQQVYSFNWQGGEPTLMGFDFFKKAIDLQIKYGKKEIPINNSLQTNATLITDELAELFGRYKFLIGVSLDGPSYIHDHYRKKLNNQGSYFNVITGIKKLLKYNVDFNILVLVNSLNVTKAKEVFNYLCSNGFSFHQYIPCVEFNNKDEPMPFSITADAWGKFLCDLFDEWNKNWKNVSIRLFNSILYYLINKKPNICTMKKNCNSYFVVEYNGDIFPCDFFVTKELKLGNIIKNSFNEMIQSKKFRDFGLKKKAWNEKCSICKFIDLCAGDCLKHRYLSQINPDNLSFLCEGWKYFFEYSMPEFKSKVKIISKMNKKNSFS